MENQNDYNAEEIFSKALRAGRRTYFFDVRETKAGDYYLTITESKKFTNEDGTFFYKKHKIYLYKEDFSEFNSSPLHNHTVFPQGSGPGIGPYVFLPLFFWLRASDLSFMHACSFILLSYSVQSA